MKKLMLLLTGVLLAAMIPAQVLAAEENPETSSASEIGASSDVSGESQETWGLEMNSQDLNDRYQMVLQELENNDFGKKFDLQFPEHEGYSIDAVQLFKDSYGDIWNSVQLESPSLPENFSASEFLQQGMETRSSLFSSAQSSDLYQSVMGQLDVGSIWKKASSGLPSAGSLMGNSFKQDFLVGAQGEKQSNQNYLAGIQEGALDLFTGSGGLLSQSNKNSFWGAVKDMKDILSSGEGSMEDVFDKMK